jgi:hypothetical protein
MYIQKKLNVVRIGDLIQSDKPAHRAERVKSLACCPRKPFLMAPIVSHLSTTKIKCTSFASA